MLKKIISTTLLFYSIATFSQELTGKELLDKAIEYHDPNGNWATFNGTLNVTMTIPKKPNRDSEIKIDLPKEYFYVKATRGENTTEYTVSKESCEIAFNGVKNPSEAILK